MSSEYLNNSILKAQAQRLGFVACGVAPAEPVPDWCRHHYLRRIQLGHFAGMNYMHEHVDMRLNPTLLVPGVRSVVSVALNYMPPRQQRGIALYAQGQDYHEVMRSRLQQLMQVIGGTGRCFVDTAPVLERYWAWRSGVGEVCRNGLISVPGYGPTVFLGELFLLEGFDAYDEPHFPSPQNHQGWQSLCPALTPDGLDASRCISYLTIEHRGDLPEGLHLPTTFYGCDRCLRACPQFAQSHPTSEQAFHPSDALVDMSEADWRTLTQEQYQRLFKGSAVKRAKYNGLIRNIQQWKNSDI